MSTPPAKLPRKFPPLCWTQEEALALIQAYTERWYALRRGYLRTADWDSVAHALGQLCPGASPAKTSAQCRHKMEKLRQRYRAEKQRSLSYPGRFFSSWFYFQSMDAMENGGSNQILNSVPLGFNTKKVDILNVDRQVNPVPLGFRLKNSGKVPVSYRVPSGGGSDDETEENNATQFEGDFRVNKFGNGGGIRIKNLSGEQLIRSRKAGKMDPDYDCGDDGGYWGKVGSDRNSNPNFDPRFMNVFSSQARSNLDRRSDTSGGVKRGRNPIEDMVSSIKLLGEGFVKVEKMKMDMAKEIEKMRMDMEMKRNEMLIESQQQIVDAFVKGFFENKAKTTLSPDS